MGCSPEKVENPVASRSPDRHRWQAPPDPRLKPRKNTHFHVLKDACYTLRMEQPRPLDGSKVQTLVCVIEMAGNHHCKIVDVKAAGFRRVGDVHQGGGGAL